MGFDYDQVLYPGFPLSQTHPDRLATIAGLCGMRVAPPDRCRVLELGCGDGGNLVPMALGLPHSEFIGLDLAGRAVARGCATIRALGLRNITLRQLDLMEVDAELGEFDYIIAHGVYSWVPPKVRDHLLRICRTNLAPQGVAYISYNTYPGFHRREMFREMMLYHVRNTADAEGRVRESVQLVEWLAACRNNGDLACALIGEERRHLAECEPWYVVHDDLAEINYAPYFHEFLQHARKHRLNYLGEADFLEMQDDIYPESVVQALGRFAGDDVARKEQYLDFVKGRRFRETLICREEMELDREARPEQIVELYMASQAEGVCDVEGVEAFRGPRGASLRTDYGPAKAALRLLAEAWPRALPFPGLLAHAGGEAGMLAAILFQGYRAGLLELHTLPSQFAAAAGERPLANPLARWQAQEGALVTTLRHTTAALDDTADRCLLMLLDGTRDRVALGAGLRRALQSLGNLEANAFTRESVEARLERFAKDSLLLG